MARPAHKIFDLAADDRMEDGDGIEPLENRAEETTVLRPRIARDAVPIDGRTGTEDGAEKKEPLSFKIQSDESGILRPVFPKAGNSTGVARFFLSPPKTIPVVDGVRPQVKGKFLFVGDDKFYVRGVTYGPFRPEEDGCEYHTPEVVDKDFAQMAANSINAVRTYTVPPRWLLDIAQKHGLRVMVGLPWEEHIAFLDSKKMARDIERRVRLGVKECAGHPALLCLTIGNEIPASIVRWYGARKVENFLKRLYEAAKAEDPEALVTYVNFPTTEYLQLPFVDFVSFNVYLETREKLEGYLARLQNLAGEKPLVMAEIGLDSIRNGVDVQASTLSWQIRSTFATGCAGMFVFSWTDEWHRGGFDIDDWGFGVTDRDRNPKPTLDAIRKAFAEIPFAPDLEWPSISVVVCSYNGSRTIRNCLDGLRRLDYPNFEVVVVNDGSTDGTGEIAAEYGFKVINTTNHGLSSARNTGMRAAKGEIVAYIDDDARPDPHWLTYLAYTFLTTDHVGVGGPNLPPPEDGPIAACVANSPGGPIHVLLTDQEAEHIPGCNMAFRKSALEAIDGFDHRFRIAGDDVDLCWRLQKKGWTLGFNPAAMVWHHRRNSVKAYWKQQKNYGKAEAFLEKKWPEKYNAAGHVPWAGRLYFKGFEQLLSWSRGRIYQGTWGSALFQSIYQPAPTLLWSLPMMPEWYAIIAALAVFSVLGIEWSPLLLALPLLLFAVFVPVLHACMCAMHVDFSQHGGSRRQVFKLRVLTATLHLMQPLARLVGRVRLGLTPWRNCSVPGIAQPWPWPRMFTVWSEQWRSPLDWLESLESGIRGLRTVVLRGGDFDRWDLELRGGLLGSVRVLMAVEEHGGGRQFVRVRTWPRCSTAGIAVTLLFGFLAACAALSHAWMACGLFYAIAFLFMIWIVKECSAAMSVMVRLLGTENDS
ncbi:glycosyltransferase [Syntrophobacter fumaroxidans]|uniref:Glycosyl transferase, family 2 n=1 Tax=Syntrophobacter fumaroxidans (strain DSM 10017 / MPOB) TaxID=335543 RepID=A0LP64_SYNFM|nr:glycosyltransferase [Syntrophobacter fumaroxidans]ABK19216.1 glycosyl transferase, family 2 [Syntrophobacter fumaroxidans MPOB]